MFAPAPWPAKYAAHCWALWASSRPRICHAGTTSTTSSASARAASAVRKVCGSWLSAGPTLRAAAGTVLYLGLVALLSVGVGTAVRDSAGAIATVLTLLYVVPMIATFVTDPQWHQRLEKLAPMTAGLMIQATRDLERLPLRPWAGLAVLAAYAGAAMLLGVVLFATRDA